MKLLFDENFSRRLVARLRRAISRILPCRARRIVTESGHRHLGVRESAGIRDRDGRRGFLRAPHSFGPLPKAIWLRGCDYPTGVAEGLIRKQVIRIAEFLQNEDQGVLVLTP